MELGGNAPFVVFADADLDAAVAGAVVAKMRHSAETCTAANRFFVEADIAADFTDRLAAAMAGIRVGRGIDEGVTCGPMINPAAIESIGSLVGAAVAGGARVAVGDTALDGPGYFFAPTVLGEVDPSSPITREEILGPVAPVIPFTDHDAMIEAANDTEMGLAAYVYTADSARGLSVAERLEAGMVGLNRGTMSDPAAPFGGMKQSGLGREGASEGIYEFCGTQYIAASGTRTSSLSVRVRCSAARSWTMTATLVMSARVRRTIDENAATIMGRILPSENRRRPVPLMVVSLRIFPNWCQDRARGVTS